MTGRKRIQRTKLGSLATQSITIRAVQKQTVAFIARQVAGAFDLSAATVVASLFGDFFRLGGFHDVILGWSEMNIITIKDVNKQKPLFWHKPSQRLKKKE